MKNKISIKCCVITFLLSFAIFGDLCIINDKDGYTNIRYDRNVKSSIVSKIYTDDIFYCSCSERQDWCEVDINTRWKENDYNKIKNPKEYYADTSNIKAPSAYGYVHKSRLIHFSDSMVETKNKIINDSSFQVANDYLYFKMVIKKFNSFDRKIEYRKDAPEHIKLIDGGGCVGCNFGLPNTEIESMLLIVDSDTINIPDDAKRNLFDVSKCITIYKINDRILLNGAGGDGDASYDIIWIIENKKYIGSHLQFGL